MQQDEKDARLQGGGVGWQPEGMLERYSRHLVEEFLHSRAQELDTQIKLVFADPSFGDAYISLLRVNEGEEQLDVDHLRTISSGVRIPIHLSVRPARLGPWTGFGASVLRF